MKLEDYIYEKPVLHTERLTLRKLVPADIKDLEEWTPNKSLYKYWGQKPSKTDLCPALLFEKEEKPTKSIRWAIELNSEHKVVGDFWVYLIEGNRQAKLAVRLSDKYHGLGIATEALQAAVRFCFEQTELQRLWTDVDVRNTASYQVLEKGGFLREGLIRQGKMVSSWCDYYIYAMLKEDYEALKARG